MTHEQEARELLDRMGDPSAFQYSTGDVVELANLFSRLRSLEHAHQQAETILGATEARRREAVARANHLEAVMLAASERLKVLAPHVASMETAIRATITALEHMDVIAGEALRMETLTMLRGCVKETT